MDVAATQTRRRPRFDRAEDAPTFQLTDRDVQIVRAVAEHRFLRSTHISNLFGASHKKICERLTSLFHAGYLDRPRSQLRYHVEGGGSFPLVYALGKNGATVLAEQESTKYTGADWKRKNQNAGREFLLHTLGIADVRIAVAVACKKRPDVILRSAEELFEELPAETRRAHTPWRWSVPLWDRGTVHDVGIIPDYVFALMFSDGRRRPYVLEYDRGSMPVERLRLTQTSMLRKFLAYEESARLGLHTARFGWKNFRVLIVTPGVVRAEHMRATIERTSHTRGSPLFLICDHAALMQSDALSLKWHDARGRPHALI
jgi:hypothetical protein